MFKMFVIRKFCLVFFLMFLCFSFGRRFCVGLGDIGRVFFGEKKSILYIYVYEDWRFLFSFMVIIAFSVLRGR